MVTRWSETNAPSRLTGALNCRFRLCSSTAMSRGGMPTLISKCWGWRWAREGEVKEEMWDRFPDRVFHTGVGWLPRQLTAGGRGGGVRKEVKKLCVSFQFSTLFTVPKR